MPWYAFLEATMSENRQFLRSLGRLMLPMAFQNFMMTLVSATDALVLARVDQYSVAAVSLATEITFVMNLFLGTIVSCIEILATQYWGKGDKKTVADLSAMALRLNFAVSLVFFLGAFFAPRMLMGLYTTDAGLIEIGAGYLKIASWSYLLSAVSQCFLCVMKISGGAMFTAIIATVTAVVDVAVDIYLVYGRGMGANGTAISTVAVCLVELVGVLLYTYCCGAVRPGVKNLLHVSKVLDKDFFGLSWPMLLNYLVWGVGFSLGAAIMGRMGADASSAYAIAALVRKLFTCFIRGLGGGAAVVIGRDLGGGNLELAKRNGGRLFKAALVVGVASAVIFCLLSPLVLEFFQMNGQTRAYLGQMTPIVAVYLVASAICVTVINGVISAGGDTKFDARITVVTMWMITLPASCLAAFVFRLPVVWVYLAVCLDEICKAFFVYPRFKKYLWLRNLTRELN